MIKNLRMRMHKDFYTIFTLKSVCVLLLACTHMLAVKFDQKISGNDVTIAMYNDNNVQIGFASYRKMPMVPWYAIHSLYIHPKFRRKGYGSTIVNTICKHLKNLKASRIYMQPGPFELQNGTSSSTGKLCKQKMCALLTFYKKLGFKKVSSITSTAAAIFYFFSGIQENAQYLMVKIL